MAATTALLHYQLEEFRYSSSQYFTRLRLVVTEASFTSSPVPQALAPLVQVLLVQALLAHQLKVLQEQSKVLLQVRSKESQPGRSPAPWQGRAR